MDVGVIDRFLEGGAEILTANELVDFADNLYNILDPEEDNVRIQFMQEDVEESKSDFDIDEIDVDEIADDIFGADGAEEEFERITGQVRPREDDDEDDDGFDVRRPFEGNGLSQVMENNRFGHKSIQLSGRPFSL